MKKILGNWWVLTGLIVLFLLLVFCLGLPYFVGMLRPWWVRLLHAADQNHRREDHRPDVAGLYSCHHPVPGNKRSRWRDPAGC